MEQFFHNELYLVLHDKDIDLINNNYSLSDTDIHDKLLHFNKGLATYFTKQLYKKPKVFVFQHGFGDIPEILAKIDFESLARDYSSIENYIVEKLEHLIKKKPDLVRNRLFTNLFFLTQYYMLVYFFADHKNQTLKETYDCLNLKGLNSNIKEQVRHSLINSYRNIQSNKTLIEIELSKSQKQLSKKTSEKERKEFEDNLILELIFNHIKNYKTWREILNVAPRELNKKIQACVEIVHSGLSTLAGYIDESKTVESLKTISEAYLELGELLDFEKNSRVNNGIWSVQDLYEHRELKHFISDLGDYDLSKEIDNDFINQIESWKGLSNSLRELLHFTEESLKPDCFLNDMPIWFKQTISEFWKLRFSVKESIEICLKNLDFADQYSYSILSLLSSKEPNMNILSIREIIHKLKEVCIAAKINFVRLFTSIRYQQFLNIEQNKEQHTSCINETIPNGVIIVIDDDLGNRLESKHGKGERRRRNFCQNLGVSYSEDKIIFIWGQNISKTNVIKNLDQHDITNEILNKIANKTVSCFLIDLFFKEGTWIYEEGEVTNNTGSVKFGLEVVNALSMIRAFDDIPILLMSDKDEISQRDKDLYLKNVKTFIPKYLLNRQLFANELEKYQQRSFTQIITKQSVLNLTEILRECLRFSEFFDPDTCLPIGNFNLESISLLILYYVRKSEEQLHLTKRNIDESVFIKIFEGRNKAYSKTNELEYILKFILVKYPDVFHFTQENLLSYPHFTFIEPEVEKESTEIDAINFENKVKIFTDKFIKFKNGKINWRKSGLELRNVYPVLFNFTGDDSKLIQDEFIKHVFELYKNKYKGYANIYLKLINTNKDFEQWFSLLKKSNSNQHKTLNTEISINTQTT